MTLEQTSTGEASVGCSLCGSQLSDRMQVVADVFAGSEEYRELSDGYEFRFPGTTEWAMRLTEFIASERNCCTFFKFELVFEPSQGPVWLRLRGGENVKEFIRTRLNAGSSKMLAMPAPIDTQEGAHDEFRTNRSSDSNNS